MQRWLIDWLIGYFFIIPSHQGKSALLQTICTLRPKRKAQCWRFLNTGVQFSPWSLSEQSWAIFFITRRSHDQLHYQLPVWCVHPLPPPHLHPQRDQVVAHLPTTRQSISILLQTFNMNISYNHPPTQHQHLNIASWWTTIINDDTFLRSSHILHATAV